ncbi:MAG: hypothetical protein HQ521_19570 [Bacteroidetes bacterium]|nr:hypothetical protein [Bacteroidota bacterium]
MRLENNINRFGQFWLPNKIENKVSGFLTISDGGDIRLEIYGFFEDNTSGLINALKGENEIVNRICGFIEEFGYVTLENCFYEKRNLSFGGISRSQIHVNLAYLGVSFDDGEEALFNAFGFSVEGIDDWIGISGINVNYDKEYHFSKIEYNHPEELTINLNIGFNLIVAHNWSQPSMPALKEAKISQKTYFKLTSKKARSIGEFISLSHKITGFTSFAIDQNVCIENVFVYSDTLNRTLTDGKSIPIQIKVYYTSILYTSSKPKINSFSMLFRFGQISNDAEKKINNWLNAYEYIEPTINLYFSTKIGAQRYVDGKFLALVQAIESYNRRTDDEKVMDQGNYESIVETLVEACSIDKREWLQNQLKYSNEISLRRRLKKVIEPFKDLIGNLKYRKKLIDDVVNTRNYFTHYDTSLKESISKGDQLWYLTLKLEAILQMHLLNVIGFTFNEIELVVKNSDSLRFKLQST